MHRFSPTELAVVKIIGRRKMSISEIAEKYYEDKVPPINPRNTIAGIVIRVNLKCEYYNFDWFLNGEGTGRHGKTVWRDKREVK